MNDLEEQLRVDLRAATSDIDSDLDAEALLATGRGLRRNRTMRRISVAVAASLAVGVVGWVGVANQAMRGTSPVVVATPSPTAASPSVPSPGTASAEISMAARFSHAPATFSTVKITASSDGSTVTAQVRAYRSGEQVASATVEQKLADERPGLVRLGDHGVVALVPGTVLAQSFLGPDGVQSNRAELGTLGVTAVIALTEHQVGRTDPELMWQDDQGVLRSTVGVVPSVRIAVAGEEVVVYRSEALNAQGVWNQWSTAVKDAKPSQMVDGAIIRGDESVSPTIWRVTQLGFLPPGSTDVELTLGTGDGDWAYAPLPDGWIAVIAAANSRDDGAYPVTKLAYTDADGVRHTHRAK